MKIKGTLELIVHRGEYSIYTIRYKQWFMEKVIQLWTSDKMLVQLFGADNKVEVEYDITDNRLISGKSIL